MTDLLSRFPARFGYALAIVLLVGLGCQRAQADVTVTETELRAPWEQHLLVLQSLSDAIGKAAQGTRGEALADSLAVLEVSLGEYETQVDRVIDRIIGDAQFAFVASETSEALSAQLGEVHSRFDSLYSALGVRERTEAAAAQASLDALRKTLAAKVAFESDVIRVRASASRQEIVALATRWWNGEERAIAVKKLVARMREQVEGIAHQEGAK
jgi:hypothetical protein